MQIFNNLNINPNLSLALGYFDGVHLGHKAVIENAVRYAHENNTKSAVITFKEHPCCYLWGVCPKYILTRKMREEKIANLGVDYLYELNFEKIRNLDAYEYLQDILMKYFKPKSISAGWNHNFGCNKTGNGKFLKDNCLQYGYEYFEIEPSKYQGDLISSTRIRNLLTVGDIESANSMLGYQFSIFGKVIRGRQIGRTIGFPTANINYPDELIELPYGVYSVIVKYKNNKYAGIANFGIRPTVNGSGTLLEVHISDFDKMIYDENIEILFNKMIRKEQKFASLDDLKEQIKKDMHFM